MSLRGTPLQVRLTLGGDVYSSGRLLRATRYARLFTRVLSGAVRALGLTLCCCDFTTQDEHAASKPSNKSWHRSSLKFDILQITMAIAALQHHESEVSHRDYASDAD